ncbi:MAG: pyridoxamine 5'-phosphate oxidase family protein [Pseudomonadota bacterium]
MAKAFAEIAFTPEVRAVQARQGSAEACAPFLSPEADRADLLGPAERAFVEARDGFYQATVSSSGWPYVQFRGGPAGFIKALDSRTLGYADLRGNRQYLSAGNLEGDGRVALFFMDYPHRRRLKVLGRAALVAAEDDPALIEALFPKGWRARPERAVLITVAALDWNCPQHIPQRLTAAEFKPHLAPVLEELEQLRAENARLRAAAARD